MRNTLEKRWVQTLVELGILPADIKPSGAAGWSNCRSPLRDEEHASFGVHNDTGNWIDQGTGEKGGPLALVQRVKGIGRRQAIELLATAASTLTARPESCESVGPNGLTVEDYAVAKQLDATWLRDTFGIRDASWQGRPAVAMPYFDNDDEVLATRYRISMTGDRFRWAPSAKANDLVYALHLVATIRGPRLIVAEGESNLHAARARGLECLTVPGVGMAHAALATEILKLSAVTEVVVLLDPDGQPLADGLARELRKRNWKGVLKCVVVNDVLGLKDLADVHVNFADDEPGFRASIASLMEEAQEPNRGVEDHAADDADFHRTDLGNARRMVAKHGADLRYVATWGKWFSWNGRIWEEDRSGEICRRAKSTIDAMHEEAAHLEEDDAEELRKHALRSEAAARISGMIRLAESEPEVVIEPGLLDADAFLLSVANGTIDLRTGKLRPHRREDLITKCVTVDFDADAKCQKWLAFLERIYSGDQKLIEFMQRAVGYSLTGDTREQVLFFAFGPGANGKSTFIRIILALMGAHGRQAESELLLRRRSEAHPTGVADLCGARFVSCTEVDDGRWLAEALVKQLTGQDPVKARFMRQDFFEFESTFKIWMAANHRPQIAGCDHAIWRRILLIPFEVTIPEAERDVQLFEKLRAELPGIVAWAVRGALEWQQHGLAVPERVRAATMAYRSSMDVLQEFINDVCVLEASAKVSASDLYAAYCRWAEANREPFLPQRELRRRLVDRGMRAPIKSTGGLMRWHGIRLKDREFGARSGMAEKAEEVEEPTIDRNSALVGSDPGSDAMVEKLDQPRATPLPPLPPLARDSLTGGPRSDRGSKSSAGPADPPVNDPTAVPADSCASPHPRSPNTADSARIPRPRTGPPIPKSASPALKKLRRRLYPDSSSGGAE